MSLLAIDPGLSHVGAALFSDDGSLIDADVFRSEPIKRPSKAVGAWYAQDLARRGTALARWLRDLLNDREDVNESVDGVVIEGQLVMAGAAGSMNQVSYGAGVVDSVCSEAVAGAHYVTPNWWRGVLGFTATPTRGLDKKTKARIKREDDRRLYALISSLRDGDRVAELVKGHGRRGSDVVHALDAFGIGSAWLMAQRIEEDKRRVAELMRLEGMA